VVRNKSGVVVERHVPLPPRPIEHRQNAKMLSLGRFTKQGTSGQSHPTANDKAAIHLERRFEGTPWLVFAWDGQCWAQREIAQQDCVDDLPAVFTLI